MPIKFLHTMFHNSSNCPALINPVQSLCNSQPVSQLLTLVQVYQKRHIINQTSPVCMYQHTTYKVSPTFYLSSNLCKHAEGSNRAPTIVLLYIYYDSLISR